MKNQNPIELDYINVDMPEAKDYLTLLNYQIAGYGTEAKAGDYGWVNVWNPKDKKEYTFYGHVDIVPFDTVLDLQSDPAFIDIDREIENQKVYESEFHELKYLDTETIPYWWVYAVVWNGKIITDVFSATSGANGRVNAWATSKEDPIMAFLLETVILDGQVRIISRQKAKELNLQEICAGDIKFEKQ